MAGSVTDFLQPGPSPPRGRGRRRWLPVVVVVAVVAVYLFATRSVSNPGWTTDYQAAVAASQATDRPLLLAFHSRGCPPCAMMDRLVFSEPIVQSALHNYVAVRVDVDRQPDLAARYRIDATPTYAMVDLQGHQVAQAAGFTGVEGFLMFLKEASKQLTQADPTSAPPPEDAPTDNP